MSEVTPLRVNIADLRRPGAARDVDVSACVPGLQGVGADVAADEPVAVHMHLERISEGIVARGEIVARWQAQCSRCLTPVTSDVRVHVDELFEAEPVDGETYRLDRETIDLELLVRDALVLELPSAPLCSPDCRGLCAVCGIDHNLASCECASDEPDPRWAALRSFDL